MGHTRDGGPKAKHIRTETDTEIVYAIDPLSIADKMGRADLRNLIEALSTLRGVVVFAVDSMHLDYLREEIGDYTVWAAVQADDTYAVGLMAEIMPLI